MSTSLIITLTVLALEFAALAFCIIKSRKPAVPGEVRVFPYTFVIILLVIAIFVTLAHTYSLITGVQLQPRKPKGMR